MKGLFLELIFMVNNIRLNIENSVHPKIKKIKKIKTLKNQNFQNSLN